jgi:hypothetical protein
MVTKKSAKKAAAKAVNKQITIKLKEGFTREELQAAITPALFKRLRAAHRHSNPVPIAVAQVIPPKFPIG